MAKRQKSNMVTRRVVLSTTYDVYKPSENGLEKIGSIDISGKPNTQEVAKQFELDEVVLHATKVNKVTYGVPIEDYMELAVIIEEKEE